jgi:membrane associated rhomboid family serine protease
MPHGAVLAPASRAWHWERLEGQEGLVQRGGGILVAIGLLLGSVIGVMQGQPSIGLIAGLAVGLVGAALVAWWDSRRRR